MTKLAIAIDLDRCVGCHTCANACKMQNNVPMGMLWNRILTKDCDVVDGAVGEYPALSRTYLPVQCQHCENPECVKVCPTGASHKLEDGTVQIDKSKCIGCQFCAMACPYGVRYLNEEERVVEKCTLCQQRTAQGELPQCVAQCGSRARFFGDLDEGLESFQALAPTHDLATPYEEMMQNRTTLGEWVEPFTEADVYHLTDTGNGPKHCYILRNRKWQGEE